MLNRCRRAHDDAGMSLIELSVGMGLLLIAMTVGANFLIDSSQKASRVTNQTLNAASGRTALNQIANLLRYADSPTAPGASDRFTTMLANEAVFYTNVIANDRSGTSARTAPAKVDLIASGATLTEKYYLPTSSTATGTGNYPSSPTTTNVLLSNLANPSTVFTYCTTATDAGSSCTAASTSATTASVQVNLVLNGLTGENQQSLQTTVSITGDLS